MKKSASPSKYLVRTPFGIFTSFGKAREILGYHFETIKRYCQDITRADWVKIEDEDEIASITTYNLNRVTGFPDEQSGKRLANRPIKTPHGIFPNVPRAASALEMTIAAVRWRLDRDSFADWVYVDTVSDLQEILEAEDMWDDRIFEENCWLDRVENILDPQKATIYYLYKGEHYTVKCRKWLDGERPHLTD